MQCRREQEHRTVYSAMIFGAREKKKTAPPAPPQRPAGRHVCTDLTLKQDSGLSSCIESHRRNSHLGVASHAFRREKKCAMGDRHSDKELKRHVRQMCSNQNRVSLREFRMHRQLMSYFTTVSFGPLARDRNRCCELTQAHSPPPPHPVKEGLDPHVSTAKSNIPRTRKGKCSKRPQQKPPTTRHNESGGASRSCLDLTRGHLTRRSNAIHASRVIRECFFFLLFVFIVL